LTLLSGPEDGIKAWHAPYAAVFSVGRVADVGCGAGSFLDLLRERGAASLGIDADPALVEAAKRRGHQAIVGDHATLATMPGAFTGVHLSHVIEHLWGDDALALLEGAHAALKPGGVVIVRTPNWSNAAVRRGGFWLDPTHKRPYPRELLERLLTDLGFDTLQAGHEPTAWEDTFVVSIKRAVSKMFMGRPIIAEAPATPAPARARVTPAPGVRFKLDWHGQFLAQHSFARVNRELARALVATGVVEVVPHGEPTALVERTLGLPVRTADATSTGLPTFALQHQWPPRLLRPQHGYSLHIQPFEYGSIPVSWAEQMPKTVDRVWCPTEHVRRIFTEAGVPAEQTFVLPWGVDPTVFHPGVTPAELDTGTKFVFLFVGGPIWRKGIDVLIDAYLAEFSAADDVALVIKAFGTQSFYIDQSATDRIAELSTRTDVPAVRYSDEMLSDDALASLYRRADVLVLPYRGEGFGLPVLEAMACGTPPIVTAGGATDDFVSDRTGFRMPARRIPIGKLDSGDKLARPGWVLDVDQATLQRSLRHAFEHPSLVRETGERAAAFVKGGHTWRHSAQRVLLDLDDLSRHAPISRTGQFEALNAYEQRTHSQGGEDGILLELFARLRVVEPFFAELGAAAGAACNTALLAREYDWHGVIVEGAADSFAAIRASFGALPNVRLVNARATREHVAELFATNGVPRGLDLLSLGTDSNGYHLWDVLAPYMPRIVVVEFNPVYPPPMRWAIAYDPQHVRRQDDYYGASLASLADLGNRLGYALLGIESTSVHAFFIRRDLLDVAEFPELAPERVYVPPSFQQPHREGPASPKAASSLADVAG
jgi:glycosyltransferase involved in cell wall biosynthesis